MKNHYFLALKTKVTGLVLALVLGSPGLLWAAGSAQVDFVVGSALASNAGGVERKLVKGVSVVSGETIRTAADSRVHLRFDDGAVISLLSNGVEIGRAVFAVGNPMGLSWSYTEGVISSVRWQKP